MNAGAQDLAQAICAWIDGRASLWQITRAWCLSCCAATRGEVMRVEQAIRGSSRVFACFLCLWSRISYIRAHV